MCGYNLLWLSKFLCLSYFSFLTSLNLHVHIQAPGFMLQIFHKVLEALPPGRIQHEGKASCSPDSSYIMELQLTWRSFITLNLNSYEVTIDASQYVRDPYSGVFVGKKLNLPASGSLDILLDPVLE